MQNKQVETQVQQKLVIFCKYLREHVEKWKLVLQESPKIIESLCNQAEQFRHVNKTNLKEMKDFENTQQTLLALISDGIEEEISAIKILLEKLNLANQVLKNKLTTFENVTTDLNWELEDCLIKGTPTQPPLAMLLTDALEFWVFFKRALVKMNETFKAIDVEDAKSMELFEKVFHVDLEDDCIVNFLALTQYVSVEVY